MKVLLCIDNLGSGGAQRQIVLLALGLQKKGFHVDLFVYYPQDFFKSILTDNNINIIYVEKTNRFGLNVVLGLRKILKNGKYDFAVSYLQTPNIYLTIAAKFSSTTTKVITSERATTNIGKEFISKVKYWCHRQSYAVVYNSFHEKDNWTLHFKALKKNSITIYNGVDTDHFRPAKEKHKRIGKIIGVGTVRPDKNIHTFIKAIKVLKDLGVSIEVNWYGKSNSSKKEKKYYTELLQLINESGVDDLWTWRAPEKAINEVMIKYDFLVLSSVVEGLPNVLCEAMACGLPIIASNVLDHPLLVKENIRGYLFELYDDNELAEKIKKMCVIDDASYHLMGNNCRRFAENDLSIDHFINSYINLFNNGVSKESVN